MQRLVSGLILFVVLSVPVRAQATRAFDVVSIREDKRNADGSITMRFAGQDKSGNLTLTGFPLDNLISMAYGVDTRNVTGLPEWSRGMFFQVQAKSEAFETAEGQKWSYKEAWQVKQEMLRTMLADRFHLVVHIDKKQANGFVLRGAGKGPLLRVASPLLNGNSGQDQPYFQSCNVTGCELNALRISMRQFAGVLSGQMRGKVTNETGLPDNGLYAFHLKWRSPFAEDSGDSDTPGLMTALKDLGLELKPVKVMEDVVVVETLEKPSEN